ncbi:MAG: hypothetical protein V1777_04415 [Candidatus Micrarchaeota archaeon]
MGQINTDDLLFKATYATLIKQAQHMLNTKEFAERFKLKTREEKIEIKKKMLEKLKGYAVEIVQQLPENVEGGQDIQKLKPKLIKIMQGCLDGQA